jgi:hypothetical protein
MFVGARYAKQANGSRSGKVYVFEEDVPGRWVEISQLSPLHGNHWDEFGLSLAVSGDTLVVGAPDRDTINDDSGAVYVFHWNGLEWVQVQELIGSDIRRFSRFGYSVAILGDTLAAGTHIMGFGAVYMFSKQQDQGWSQIAKLTAPNNPHWDLIGHSLALADGVLLAGAPFAQSNGVIGGAAYLFGDLGSGDWHYTTKLVPDDGDAWEDFGRSVGLSGASAAVASPGHTHDGVRAGSTYIFDLGCQCYADFNHDGTIDSRDLTAFLNDWVSGAPSADCDANAAIDSRDVICYLNTWSSGCP